AGFWSSSKAVRAGKRLKGTLKGSNERKFLERCLQLFASSRHCALARRKPVAPSHQILPLAGCRQTKQAPKHGNPYAACRAVPNQQITLLGQLRVASVKKLPNSRTAFHAPQVPRS